MKIGGIDASVVKHPLTDEPYIPGSSIKGKMRALIEMTEYASELVQTEFKPVNNETTQIAQYFGASKDEGGIPAKILFDDFMLTEERKNAFEEKKSNFMRIKLKIQCQDSLNDLQIQDILKEFQQEFSFRGISF